MKKKLLTRLLTLAAGLAFCTGAAQAATNELAGFLTGTNIWYSTNTYILTNRTYVMDGAVLIIQPGTVVRGRNGTPPNYGSLFVTQGGKVYAQGTECAPIIFTSEGDVLNDPFDLPVGAGSRGLWGGICVLGKARINASANATNVNYDVYEGLPDTQEGGQFIHRFGGSDDNDSSGVFQYVSVRHGSKLLGEVNKEINGWSFCGVGRGTVVEHIESYLNADDGVEMFGGCVDLKYVVSAFNEDEAFDTDQGYNGRVQFLFTIQDPSGRDEGAECNGQPNSPFVVTDGNAAPKSTFQLYNATMIGAGTTGSGNDTMNLRVYNFSQWHNNVFTEFQGVRANIDGTSQPDVSYNIYFNHAGGNGSGYGGTYCPAAVNPNVDPLIRSIDRGNNNLLDPRPSPGSPVYTGYTNAPNDGFFSVASYKGAFDCENWLRGWTALDDNAHLGVFVNTTTQTNELAGFLTGTNIWYSTNTYILTNRTYVMDGAVLIIQPGTVVRGRNGTPPNYGSLFVTQGGKVYAQGTECAPIIFTSEGDVLNDPFDLPVGAGSRGLWGGICVLGKARINASANATNVNYDVYEGLPDTQEGGQFIHRFGGSDDNDSSGVFQYVSVRHGSKLLGEVNKEINGWSFCGVGRGTVVEHIESYLNADDGVEMFGGCVDLKYVVSAFNEDEAFDTDQGYNGRVQFLFTIQDPSGRDEGAECNGQPNSPFVVTDGNAAPKSTFQLYNATMIGAGTTGSGNDTMNLRVYNFAGWHNSVFTEFQGVRANIDGTSQPDVSYNIFFNHMGGNGSGYGGTYCPAAVNPNVDPLLTAIDRGNNGLLNAVPLLASPVYTGYTNPPTDGFFAATDFKGAFDCGMWVLNWSAIDHNAHLAPGISHDDSFPVLVPTCPAPTLTVTLSGTNLNVAWPSTSTCAYQLKSSTNVLGVWVDEGGPFAGTGSTLSTNIPAVDPVKFFKVLAY